MADSDLPALLARSQRGDRAAFDSFVHSTARLVYAQIALSVRDRHQAEDLTQDTFLAAWKGLPALQSAQEPRAAVNWLLTVARNKVLDSLKAGLRLKRGGTGVGDAGAASLTPGPVLPTPAPASRASGPADPADLPDHAPSPHESAELRESRQRALDILDELPEDYRRPLAMRYLADADYQSIRRALDLTDGALRGLLTRGMALLRERMTRPENDKVAR